MESPDDVCNVTLDHWVDHQERMRTVDAQTHGLFTCLMDEGAMLWARHVRVMMQSY